MTPTDHDGVLWLGNFGPGTCSFIPSPWDGDQSKVLSCIEIDQSEFGKLRATLSDGRRVEQSADEPIWGGPDARKPGICVKVA